MLPPYTYIYVCMHNIAKLMGHIRKAVLGGKFIPLISCIKKLNNLIPET